MAAKTRTITLTGRRPVRINDAEWPKIAEATDDSYGYHDMSRHQQAVAQGEVDRYHLIARQHADGRVLVYGILDAASVWTGSEDYRGGRLLQTDEDVANALREVGAECGLPESVIRDAIADLEPEAI